jgi:hypothetical protein
VKLMRCFSVCWNAVSVVCSHTHRPRCSPFFRPPPRAANCLYCDAGTYATQGLTSCINCAAGSYSTVGLSFCFSCQPGYFSASVADTNCTPCEMGVCVWALVVASSRFKDRRWLIMLRLSLAHLTLCSDSHHAHERRRLRTQSRSDHVPRLCGRLHNAQHGQLSVFGLRSGTLFSVLAQVRRTCLL